MLILQIHYDLGAYHFLQERYEDGYSHFAEAYKLMSELGPQSEYCQVNIDKLKGYYNSCASLCGRSTPLEKRSLYDRFLYSVGNGYQVWILPFFSLYLSTSPLNYHFTEYINHYSNTNYLLYEWNSELLHQK